MEPLSCSDDNDQYVISNENVIKMDNQNEDNTETQDNSHPNSQASNNTTLEVVLTITTANAVPIVTPLITKWKMIMNEEVLQAAKSAINLGMTVTWRPFLSIRRKCHL